MNATRSRVPDWPAEPGDYVLVWWLAETWPDVPVGRLGTFDLAPGTWVYVGSARGPGGLRARIARHERADKPRHWHIDHLTATLPRPRVIVLPEATGAPLRLECRIVQRLLDVRGFAAPIAGFGSGDCDAGCPSHLLRHRRRIDLGTLRGWCLDARS